MNESYKSGLCGLCSMGCEAKTLLMNGVLSDVKADSEAPHGYLCPIGRCAPQIVYARDRITRPLIRAGRKGSFEFRDADWEEALSTVASGLRAVKSKYGAGAAVSYMGRGTLEDSLTDFGDRILSAFGSPNDLDCGSICFVASRILAPNTTLGIRGRHIEADFQNADAIVVWGANPAKDCPPAKLNEIMSAKKRGATLIVIDPRRNMLGRIADCWIPVRPGTDGALALGLANLAIQRSTLDAEFVENWTVGFEDFANYASDFTPEKTAALCSIRGEDLLWLSQAIAFPRKTAWIFYTGLEYAPSAVQNVRALYTLAAITGNIDERGGLYIKSYPLNEAEESTASGEGDAIGAREYPVFYSLSGKGQFIEFPKAVLKDDPYPARSLLLVGGSPTTSYPDPELWKSVYERLDFMAVVDRFITPECLWADVILPATTGFENLSYHFNADRVRLREKVMDPVGMARNDTLILAQIAGKLGYGDLYPQDEQEILRRAFRDHPAIYEELMRTRKEVPLSKCALRYAKYKDGLLRRDGKPGFPTPSGKFEIRSTLLDKHGYAPLPVYTHPYAATEDDGYGEYPLSLTTGARSIYSQNSQYLNIPQLTSMQPHPLLEMNPKDAEQLGIRDGETVWLKTAQSQVRIVARITPDIGPGIVHAPFGGGSPAQVSAWREFNVNALVDFNERDPISGYVVNKALRCKIEK